jgi:hypothetical protein
MRRRATGCWFSLAGVFSLLIVACAPVQSAQPASDVSFVIPSGTEAALDRGEAAFRFPEEIDLSAGQSVVITNDDHAMHYFFDIPVAPGQTIRKEFPRVGAFVYQGGLSCSISRTNTIMVHVS